MSQCRYRFAEGQNVVNDFGGFIAWFQLPSGFYELKGQLAWDFEFILAPSGDTNEAIILTNQTSISGQLKALSDEVAQMETDKIADIERIGYVRTDIVGISKDSPPEDYIVSGENEDASMEDGGGDETSGGTVGSEESGD
ncbi:uncharacterized protein M437DRAFT_88016 [Aureobasidium melanogenum CBS 110374]|uniref:Uncharacterized protein n=1 Tax=Aureobasidium melanogenum (strain CBS 110374) TaxID=1043003 RepID=A0A074W949_AURM1|nr:uncharacterized protein M437DRAFT_88016 [Aureobasidium melanogenum CBS 110374]KEQ59066.1 hypothetical protein M437DRAFT_88016 [Aureobasidium melanogenum CBS 110374]